MSARSSLIPLILAVLGFVVGGLSVGVTAQARSSFPGSPLLVGIDPQFLKVLAGSQAGSLSSVRWVETIFDYAAASIDGAPLDLVRSGIQITRTLDPDWETPYEFGGLVFDDPNCPECLDFAQDLLSDASRRFPAWRYKVYYGMFLLKRRQDTAAAIEVLEPLSRLTDPNVPSFVRGLAVSVVVDQQGVVEAIRRLVAIRWSDSSALGMVPFFRMQTSSLLEKEAGLSHTDSRLVSPILRILFESENSEERDQAMGVLNELVEAPSENRKRILTILAGNASTAPESESSKNP